MSKIQNGGLNQYGAGPFGQQQFGTAGVAGVKRIQMLLKCHFVNLRRMSTFFSTQSNALIEPYDFTTIFGLAMTLTLVF